MEFINGHPAVRRKAVFLSNDGLASVIDIILRCDRGNHMAPMYPLSINFQGSEYRFLRDANEPQKRPIYKEVDGPEPVGELPRHVLEHNLDILQRNIALQEEFAFHLLCKIHTLEKSELPISEIQEREVKLFNEQKKYETPED